MDYPKTATVEQVDDYHGTAIADPYRWLEDADASETRAWIAAQNTLTEDWLAGVPARAAIRERLAQLWDHPRAGAPWRRGERWFQLRNSGLQNQDVLYVLDAPDREGRVLLDPNTLSPDGTVALSAASVSHDGELLAYATSDSGSDWLTWRVRRIRDGQDLPDQLEWAKFSSAAWAPDASGFYYACYDAPAAGEAYEATNRNQRLAFHRLGDDQAADAVVHARPDQPEWGFDPRVTEDGRWLVITVWHGTHPHNALAYLDLADPDADVAYLFEAFDASYGFVGNDGTRWLLLTDLDAPRQRVLAVDVPTRVVAEVVAESDDTLERARLVGGRLVTVALHHARHRLRVYDLDGMLVTEAALPDLATIGEITGRQGDDGVHLTVSTFTTPVAVWRHDLASATTVQVRAPGVPVDPDDFVAEQVFVPVDDATSVPLFVLRRAGVVADGNRPALLYGYGGFNIPVTPGFKPEWLVWLERGGVLGVANLRGGGEYGRAWHDAGRLASKQNVFDDFAACAQWLIDAGWTRPERLAITGRSNGGLLVGASITQRPELFGAAVPEVGVLDMLRFHRFTIGWAWTSDYGSADDAEQFATLRGYSPLHNVRPGTAYPPTLVTTGDHDDRVVPGHSFKFAAALQAAQAGDAPVLLRVDTAAGHGAGKPTAKLIDERADVLAFLDATLQERI
jgi:prolyl oligopeptidase